MKRLLLLLLIAFSAGLQTFAQDVYTNVGIEKGSFIRVVNQREISTAVADEGDIVTFITNDDLWIGETKVLPSSSVFHGLIEELHEPVQGTNASVKIKIFKVVLPNGKECDVDGYIYDKGSSTIGGELTPPMEYAKVPHYVYYPRVYKGYLQYVPGNKRFFGVHAVIKSGAELLIMLNKSYIAPI